MIKTLAACVVAAWCGGAQAADWVEIDGAMKLGKVYVDGPSIRKDADGVTAWFKYTYDTPVKVGGGNEKYFKVLVSLDRLDCRERTSRLIQNVLYGPEGDVVEQTPFSSSRVVKAAVPGTTMDVVLGTICASKEQSDKQWAQAVADVAASAASANQKTKKAAKPAKAASKP